MEYFFPGRAYPAAEATFAGERHEHTLPLHDFISQLPLVGTFFGLWIGVQASRFEWFRESELTLSQRVKITPTTYRTLQLEIGRVATALGLDPQLPDSELLSSLDTVPGHEVLKSRLLELITSKNNYLESKYRIGKVGALRERQAFLESKFGPLYKEASGMFMHHPKAIALRQEAAVYYREYKALEEDAKLLSDVHFQTIEDWGQNTTPFPGLAQRKSYFQRYFLKHWETNLANSPYFGLIMSRLYGGSWNTPKVEQDFRFTFTANSLAQIL